MWKGQAKVFRDVRYILETRNPVENLNGFSLNHKDQCGKYQCQF